LTGAEVGTTMRIKKGSQRVCNEGWAKEILRVSRRRRGS
jgi:hypothetical protein